MSQDVKVTITRGKFSFTVEAKGVTINELTVIAMAAKENMENLPMLLDQAFREFESAIESQKQKLRELSIGAITTDEPKTEDRR